MRGATLICCLLMSGPALAAPRILPLDPAHAVVTFRAYAMRFMPIDGRFTRFHGTLATDPAHPGTCHVEMTVEVASLDMPDDSVRDDILSPSLLDVAAYPTLAYTGDCKAQTIVGTLDLHGERHGLTLAVTRTPTDFMAQAQLRRAEWGITGRPLLAGATVRIQINAPLPPD